MRNCSSEAPLRQDHRLQWAGVAGEAGTHVIQFIDTHAVDSQCFLPPPVLFPAIYLQPADQRPELGGSQRIGRPSRGR